MMGLGLGMGIFGFILMLLFLVGLVLLAMWLIGLLFPPVKEQSNNGNASLSAQEILEVRYARGELTDEQYQQMLQTLQE